MRIKGIMTHHIEQTVADATVLEVATQMAALDVGMMPVFKGSDLVGVVTDRDIVVRVVAAGLDPAKTLVRQVMTKEVVTCREDEDDRQAAEIMEEHQLRRLIVVTSEGRPVGICSLADIARRSRDRRLAGDVVQEIVQPGAGHR